MSRINCSVRNCSHHKDGVCFANAITIVGASASKEDNTCCGSYLNKSTYSDLTNNTQSGGPCDALICNVETCTHNCNSLCQLDSIVVDSTNNPVLYIDTACSSYRSND